MEKIKILVSYHKPFKIIENDIVIPIHTGRELAENNEENSSLFKMTGDNSGDNISSKNATYNELTAIYWAWKNYGALGNPDYVGFMQYRRHFIFKTTEHTGYVASEISDDYLEKIGYSKESLEKIAESGCIVIPKPAKRKSVYRQYSINHDASDLTVIKKIIDDKYPEFSSSANKYLNGKDNYFYNMFIFPKEIFFSYAKWLFDILDSYTTFYNRNKQRLFVAERLTGIYITHLLDSNVKYLTLSTVLVDESRSLRYKLKTAAKISRDKKGLKKLVPFLKIFIPKKCRKDERQKLI